MVDRVEMNIGMSRIRILTTMINIVDLSHFFLYASIYYYSHDGINDSFPNKIDFHDGVDNWHEEGRYTLYAYQDRILNIIDFPTLDGNDHIIHYKYQKNTPHCMKVMVNRIQVTHFQAQTTLPDELMAEITTHLKDVFGKTHY